MANGTGIINRLAAGLIAQGHAEGTARALALGTLHKWGQEGKVAKDLGREVLREAAPEQRIALSTHATPEELQKIGEREAHRLTIATGVRETLCDEGAKKGMAFASARALREGATKVKVSLSEPEPNAAELADMREWLTAEVEATSFLVEAISPKLRTATGKFHGMHGMETRGSKGKLLKGEGAAKCETCGAIKPGKDATCPKGHKPLEEADHKAKPKGERECKMPHDSLSKQGKRKCPACGANIGQREKTVEEADAEHALVNYAPNVHFDPAKHPRDKIGKFMAVLDKIVPNAQSEGVHEVELPSGVSVEKTALGGGFWVVGKGGKSKQKFKDKESAALGALLADVMGGKVLTEAEMAARTPDELRKLVEAPPRGGGPTGKGVPDQTARGLGGTTAKPNKMRGGQKGKPKGRGGGDPNSGFEQQHPRGRGGVWIKKGAGTGSKPDPQVAGLQRRLQQLGYGPGSDDGRYGDLTEQSVRKFQADYGLRQTGEVDPATLQTLQTPPAQKLADIQAQNAQIAAMPNAQGHVAGSSSSTGTTATAASKAAASNLNPADPNSVRTFQTAHGLKADGVIGPATQEAIRQSGSRSSSTSTTSAGRSRGSTDKPGTATAGVGTLKQGVGVNEKPDKSVKDLQRTLDNLGYSLGGAGVDGRFGKQTKKAVEKFQRQHGLVADGIVGPETRKKLERVVKRANKPKEGVTSADEMKLQAAHTRAVEAERLRELCEQHGDIEGYVRARAEAMRWRDVEESWLERLHPRDRAGKFREKLTKLPVGHAIYAPNDGPKVWKLSQPANNPRPQDMTFQIGSDESNYGLGALKIKTFDVAGPPKRATGVETVLQNLNLSSPVEHKSGDDDITGLKRGHSVEVGGHTVRRGITGFYVDEMPYANAADASYAASHRDIHSDVERARALTRQREGVTRARRRALLHADTSVVGVSSAATILQEESLMRALHLRLEEAVADRLAAEHTHDSALFTDARAREASLTRQIVEGRALPEADRRRYATVREQGEYKFPIRPGNKQDARDALRLLQHGALTPDQRQRVVERAKEALVEADVVVEGVELMVGYVLDEAADSMAKASSHEQVGHGGRNWITRMGEQLPAYIQHIANDLMEKRGKSESNAVQMAIGIVKRWAKGAGNVQESTRAAAAKAVAEWEALKAKNKARKVAEAEEAEDDDPEAERMVARMKKKGVPEAAARKMAAKSLNKKKLAEALDIAEGYLLLEEGLSALVAASGPGLRSDWQESKHPRNRLGKFVDVLHKLTAGVTVKYPHGTSLRPIDGPVNKYALTDPKGTHHTIVGKRFAAAYASLHDKSLPTIKADPGVGGHKEPQHFAGADAINRNFLHDLPTEPIPREPAPLAPGETRPNIRRWPQSPADVPAFQAGRGHMHSWREFPQTGSDEKHVPLPTHEELLKRELASMSPEQRAYFEDESKGVPYAQRGQRPPDASGRAGTLGLSPEKWRNYQAYIERVFKEKSDDDLHQMMRAIRDPVGDVDMVTDLANEMRRRKGDTTPPHRSTRVRPPVSHAQLLRGDDWMPAPAPHHPRTNTAGDLRAPLLPLQSQRMSPEDFASGPWMPAPASSDMKPRRVEHPGLLGYSMLQKRGVLAEGAVDGEMQPSSNMVPTAAIQTVADPDAIKQMSLSEIAHNIASDWGSNANFAAVSYLDAMRTAKDTNTYAQSPFVTIVRNFLQNAADWDGPVASVVKPELARRLRLVEEAQ